MLLLYLNSYKTLAKRVNLGQAWITTAPSTVAAVDFLFPGGSICGQ